jgi:predicted Zn-dependent peptidase
MSQIERITERLEKPELDDRSYRVIRLPNQLEALLVHDPDTDKASAAVNVNVGNFSDQDDMPGMAHAVEHLLFMGTKKVSMEEPSLAVPLPLPQSRTTVLTSAPLSAHSTPRRTPITST